jgi:glucuronate isomerase
VATKKLENMDDQEFMDSWTALGEQVTKDKERLREYSQEHQRRTRTEQLKNMGLTQSDLELLQSAGPEGVVSEEAVLTGGDE